jgi:hypothetical protein
VLKQFEIYIWAAAAVALVIGFSVYTHKQREIGRQEIIAKDAEIVRAKEIKNAEVEARAAAIVEIRLAEYKASIALPVANPHVVRVCPPAARRSDSRQADAGAATRDHGAGGLPAALDPGAEAPGTDIGPFTETLLRDATARVAVLQEYIRTCQREGFCKGEPTD